MEVNSNLALGKIECPLKGNVAGFVKTPHPADNIAGAIAARNFPEKCPICSMRPGWPDFDID
ncbi:MAG: hypothetical protein UT39_C0005G0005 [Candidatus Woesebacteria bacterium GW2011_GWA1_39_21]|uniref:Uncharacterized protein n=1 Tax=Candidatus Woesebacteria bacterium GW2011_GWA1_39_21 TaxID=1618550 RepID=A0A0G0QMF4_9BACT|nr:MAG: hypothetical protein UT39_C0005G0005 [Candidatus Woesebacteria bacterium GW2011_GWA1_39_21]